MKARLHAKVERALFPSRIQADIPIGGANGDKVRRLGLRAPKLHTWASLGTNSVYFMLALLMAWTPPPTGIVMCHSDVSESITQRESIHV
ncbi:hypothetical protein, partial [Planktotalea arctica]|uniref:hypothetical protein n=1 Tax=Planktotalea arctica TaxID=1481893 RepID=UPI00321AD21D